MNTQTLAYKSILPHLGPLQREVLAYLRLHGPSSREEIAVGIGRKESSLCARIKELDDAGQLLDVGSKRSTSTGRIVSIYAAAPQQEELC